MDEQSASHPPTANAAVVGAPATEPSYPSALLCIGCFSGRICVCESSAAPGGKSEISGRKSLRSPWQIYSYRELSRATDNFHIHNKIGEGGFGTVYYGRTSRGVEQIAVKRLKTANETAEMEFAVEVEMLGRVRHKNLLGLRGFCTCENERLIVYDYMPNRSLSSHLHGGRVTVYGPLRWTLRMKIAIGAAEGISYLHEDAKPQMVHRDVKPSNVLLDADFNPKVADFGFAKLIPDGESHVITRVKGTLGYMAPEYAMWGRVSSACDVFSFGVVLLELVTGRKPFERRPGGGGGGGGGAAVRDIVRWAADLEAAGKTESVADVRLAGAYDGEQLQRMVAVALMCTNPFEGNRPAMREVVEMLKVAASGVREAARTMKKSVSLPLPFPLPSEKTVDGKVEEDVVDVDNSLPRSHNLDMSTISTR